MKTKTLWKYRKNYYSQNGEDGIIEEILKRLNIDEGWFVEFGAWDGKYLSNTFRLLEQGWEGIDIECDPEKYKDLKETSKEFPKLNIVKTNILINKKNCLDTLLLKYPIPKEFEILSIDIDSVDYYVWDSFKMYKPKIVIIEVNSRIKPGKKYISNSGVSFTSMVDLGRTKGYTPVCHTGNIIFVRNDLVNKLNLPNEELDNPDSLFRMKWVYLKPLYKFLKLVKLK